MPGPYNPAAVKLGTLISQNSRRYAARVAPEPPDAQPPPLQEVADSGASRSHTATVAERSRQAVGAVFSHVQQTDTGHRALPDGTRKCKQQGHIDSCDQPAAAAAVEPGGGNSTGPAGSKGPSQPDCQAGPGDGALGQDRAPAPTCSPSPRNPLTAANTSRRSARAGMPAESLYERLKQLRPAEQQEELEEQEVYWEEQDLQDRRVELQRRAQDEELLERLKRRVAGEKVDVPRTLQRLKTFLTPRSGRAGSSGANTGRSSVPASGSARHLLVGPMHASSEGSVLHQCNGTEVDGEAAEASARSAWAKWWGKTQQAAEFVTTHPDFQFLVMLVILLNCIALALYRPGLPHDDHWNRALKDIDIAVNVLFTLELVLMVLAAGGPIEFLRGPWNVFDFFMVLAGYTAFIPDHSSSAPGGGSSSGSSTAGIRALRALRALRPLRTITRFEALRSIVVCFLEAVPMLVSVIGLLFFFMLLFAIAATVLFLDASYFACTNDITLEVEGDSSSGGDMWGCGARSCPSNMTCTAKPMEPPFQTAGFGNVGLSMLSLFQTTTLTDWCYQLYLVMDYAGPWPIVFYIIYIMLQCYFVVNLFLAVLKHRFAAASSLYAKVAASHGKPRSTLVLAWQALRARIKQHMATQRSAFEERMSQRSSRATISIRSSSRAGLGAIAEQPAALAEADNPPKGLRSKAAFYFFELRWRVRQVIDHPAFTWTFMAAIVANTVLLAMTTAAFTILFTLECAIKLLGYGLAGYFSDGMNAFDFAIVVLSFVDMFASIVLKLLGLGVWGFLSDGFNSFDLLVVLLGLLEMALTMGTNGNAMRSFRTLRVLRSFRVLRVLKIFRYLDSLRVISEVMMGSMGQFLAIALLMVLFIFVFALIGLQVFGQQSADFDPPLPSFLGFWNGFILVFQVLTLENWPSIQFTVQAAAGWPSVFFFVAWVTVGKWVILTLFLAITLSAFEQSYERVSRTTGGSLSRAIATVNSLRLKLLACCRCGQQPSTAREVQEDMWKGGPLSPTALTEDPPLLSEAAAKQAADVLSAAMSVKLAAAAPAEAGAPCPVRPQSEPELLLNAEPDKAAAEAASQATAAEAKTGEEDERLIKAASSSAHDAVDSWLPNASPQWPQPTFGHVDSLVGHFERLSHGHGKQPHQQSGVERDLADDRPVAQLNSGIPDSLDLSMVASQQQGQQPAAAEQAADMQQRGSLPSLQTKKKTRFVGIPEEDPRPEGHSAAAGSIAADSLAEKGTGEAGAGFQASHQANHLQQPGGVQQSGPNLTAQALHRQQNLIRQQSMLQQNPLQKLAGPSLQGACDQRLAEELQQADDASLMSGASGASSASSHFSRLVNHTRRRSRRKDYPALRGVSLYYFKVDNPVRGWLYQTMTMQLVDYLLVLVVLLSCVEMAMETASMDPHARKARVLHWIDVGTTITFALEALCKIVAFGFKPYWSFNTNRLDLVVVAVSAVVLIAESTNARFVKVLRVLRAVRPLRMLTRSQQMLMVFHTLVRSLAAMGNVTVLVAMVFLIYSILGVQLFAGLLWSCNDTSVANKAECTGTYLDPSTGEFMQRDWTNEWLNFDNVGKAFITLFITATLDGYTPTMYMSMATQAAPDLQPRPGSNPLAFLYWFTFITLCSFFVLNLTIGVVFYEFQRLKLLSETGSAVLTATQTGHVEMLRAVFRLKPIDVAPAPTNLFRRWCHWLAYNCWFDRFMMLTVVLNIILTATSFRGAPAKLVRAQEIANTFFSAIVIVEAAIKLAAMGPQLYWRSNWHKLDAVLSLAALIDIVTEVVNAATHSTVHLGAFKKVMMLARVLRMFRLLRHFKGIQMLLSTLIISLPAVANVGALLFLLFFIFSYMGVLLFGNVVWQGNLNAHANFSTFPRALLLLFRVATGDNWAGLLQDCMVRPPACDPGLGNCGHWWAPLYFFTFFLSGAMVAMNLLTTVILETFEKIQDTAAWTLTPQHLEDFVALWSEYDDGSAAIDPSDLETLLRRLPPPMGLGPRATESDVMRFVFSLDIPLDDRGLVPFHRTVYELVLRASKEEIPEGELKRRLDRMVRRFLTRHAPKQEEEHMNFQVAITVMRIQRKWRQIAARRKAEREAARPIVPRLRLSLLGGR